MKTIEKIYESEEILESEDLYEIQDRVASMGCSIEYLPTGGEIGWADFIRGKYSIADWFFEHLEENEDGVSVLTFDDTFNEALEGDCAGMGKAVMLDDSTALQKLFFWCYREPIETDLEGGAG